MVYHGLYSYRQQLRVITLLPNIFFLNASACWASERKVWRVQVAHLHNAARALSSRSRCFQLWTNVEKDFFHYLWYCGKKQIEYGLAWSVLLSVTIQVITVVKICYETMSDTSTKSKTAIFKICPHFVRGDYDSILGQWGRENFYNHLSNYTKK